MNKYQKAIRCLQILGCIVIVFLSYLWIGNYFYFKEATPEWVKDSLNGTFTTAILIALALSAILITKLFTILFDGDD